MTNSSGHQPFWTRVPLGSLCKISSGGTPDRKTSHYWAGGTIPWVTTGEINYTRIDFTNEFITEEGLKHSSAKVFPEGTVLVALYGQGKTRGRVGVLGISAATNQACAALIPDGRVDSMYLYHYMVQSYSTLRNLSNAGGQENLSAEILSQLLVPLPPLDIQHRIAEILSTWDDAIRLSELIKAQLASTYKAAAQVYLCGRRQTQYRLEQLLIPDQPQIVEPEGPFPALGVRSHGKGTIRRIEALSALDSGKTVYQVEPNKFIVNIVFAWEGAAAITSEADEGCLVSHRFPMFTVNPNILSLEYFRHVIRTDSFRQLLALASPGGAGRNKTLNRGDLLRFQIGLPSIARQVVIASMLNDLDRKISVLGHYILALRKQRDALASELLTGRLRVPLAAASGS